MISRTPNHRLVKIHRNYTVEEAAKLFCIHRNTVRAWIKQGLPIIDRKRPMLILGRDLSAFLQARRSNNKRTCRPGEFYCIRCRIPRRPAGDMADYKPVSTEMGNLEGICPVCHGMIYRWVTLSKLAQVCAGLNITMPQAPQRIGESIQPGVNSDFKQGETNDDAAQFQ